jgi:hypothetical protein
VTASPTRILLFLILAAASLSGWLYGLHWKRVAIGSKPTNEEELILSLQDQLDRLREENGRLAEALYDLQDPITENPDGIGKEPR